MSSHDENTESIDYTIRNISTSEQIVISFESNSSCDEDQNLLNYKRIVGNILRGRDVIVVSKQDQLKDLISGAVDASGYSYVINNAVGVVSFTPRPISSVEHHATMLKGMPTSVAEDLASSTEFIYGNLWFLIPPADVDTNQCKEDVVHDVRTLAPSGFRAVPGLRLEAVASPAMYDGDRILWFNPDQNLLVERFAYKM